MITLLHYWFFFFSLYPICTLGSRHGVELEDLEDLKVHEALKVHKDFTGDHETEKKTSALV